MNEKISDYNNGIKLNVINIYQNIEWSEKHKAIME